MRALASVALALVAAVFVSGAAADGGGRAESVAFGAGQLWTTVQDRLVSVDPVTGRSRAIRTGVYGTAIAVTSRTAWRLQPHSLFGVNLSTRRVRVRLGFGHAAYALAAGYGAVWLPSFGSDTLTKVDGRTGGRRWQVRVAHSPEAVTTGDGSVWLASTGRWHKGAGTRWCLTGTESCSVSIRRRERCAPVCSSTAGRPRLPSAPATRGS